MQKIIRDPNCNDKKLRRSAISKGDNQGQKDGQKYDYFGRINKKFQTSNYNYDSNKNSENKTNLEEEKGNTEMCLGSESEADLIKKLFGIEDFDSSKNKDHSSSSKSCASIRTRRKYRQYMNRPGGFNRPLSPSK
ncbi:hypothetical protein FG386_002667 [Cryptosporidium ryanae]|uniref:uncharacterized protein n=1 Tax=Cryptosporidium ryanae TaxID=515981 RepID=UPI00351A8D68|nr:hypothetical protein FG386_002667 [Cryptosporidium ryanae]